MKTAMTSSTMTLKSTKSESNELIDIFNIKTKEITEAMQGLHFSTIVLRNKLSRGHITNNYPIYHSGHNRKQCYYASYSGDISPGQILLA